MDVLKINTFGRSAPHEIATRQGFYAQENLKVEHHVTNSSKEQMQELKDGVWQVVHTNSDNVFWWNEDNGADFVIVMATPGMPNQSFVVRPEIHAYEDLRGKPIAVDAAESGFITPLRVLLRHAGLAQEGRDFTLLQVGNTSFRIDAMRESLAFGAMVGAGQVQELEAEGYHALDSINRLYKNYASSTAVSRPWAEGNSDLLVRYLRAQVRAGLWAEDPANTEEARAGGPLRGGGRSPAGGGPPPFGWEGLREMLETRKDVGLLRGAVDPHRFADDRYYQNVVGSLK